jgi:hypothetical protein
MRIVKLALALLSNLFIFSYLNKSLRGAVVHELFIKSGSLVALLSSARGSSNKR